MRKVMLVLAVVAGTGLVAQAASAQSAATRPIRFGVQADWGTDNIDFGVGARLVYPGFATVVGVNGLEAYGSFDLFFPSGGNYWEINPGITYNVTLPGVTGFSPYVGGGLGIAHWSGGGVSHTDAGLNLLGGGRFTIGKLSAFAEGRIELSGGEHFVATFGLLF